MVPPGCRTSYPPAHRPAGACLLEGRAWSGAGAVERSTSASTAARRGRRRLEPAGRPHAWRGWTSTGTPQPGDYVLRCRARDETGDEQPADPPWNLGGYANNAAQRVRVTVT